VSFEGLLLPYLAGVEEITLHDSYIRQANQGWNLVELLAGIAAAKDPADNVDFVLITAELPRSETRGIGRGSSRC
jgi:ATP-dependent Lon protease